MGSPKTRSVSRRSTRFSKRHGTSGLEPQLKLLKQLAEGRHPDEFKRPDGVVIRWVDIINSYMDVAEGQHWPPDRIARDFGRMRRDYRRVALATRAFEHTNSYTEAGKMVGVHPQTMRDWFERGLLPPSISPNVFAKYMRGRKPVSLNTRNLESVGYSLGTFSVGRLQQNRRSSMEPRARFSIFTRSNEVANHAGKALLETFGIPFVTKSKSDRRHTHKQFYTSRHSAALARVAHRISEVPSIATLVPDSGKSRLGLVKAVVDLGSTHIDLYPNPRDRKKPPYRQIVLFHDDPRVRSLISRSLEESGIPHKRTTIKLRLTTGTGKKQSIPKQGIRISGDALPIFARKVGFRDPERQRRISAN